ncbi:beta-ketoacyl synthase chain length factor [Ramlibacter sp. AW1]|uniref:Beta-ketoacyl synthase chain length factor n=1 Tax=Ramlibacter aurantiacus TaxID=2801330 RepID=A0A937D5M6_9BURK|nr:beta-ketoacyl synthase chain length factor [Ramlibacter aurantiacus]MBL0418896.1 beta-ketoacyl synthase chain length factor [Ramlibacter aurantiacus]
MANGTLRLLGVGLIGPGLASWAEALPLLRGEQPYQPGPTTIAPPQCLPAAERRRAGTAVKIALAAAEAACAHADTDPATLATVFTSSSGDGANCHALCEALASADPVDRLISPTRFTNSVHNAAAGYWHIGVKGRAASTSLCAHDESFATGLSSAAAQVLSTGAPVLLVASDTPYPEPLHASRPLACTLGLGLVLAPGDGPAARGQALLRFDLRPARSPGETSHCQDPALEALRTDLPAGRALPLLEALARGRPARVALALPPALSLLIDLDFA